MNQDKILQDILEIVQFLKDNMASKADLARFATKEDLLEMKLEIGDLHSELTAAKTEIISHVDSFISSSSKT